MSEMQITKTADDRYHVKVRDRFLDEDVDAAQIFGITSSGHTVGTTAHDILRLFDSRPIGYTMTVDYD
jgi:hypothetical protein